MGLIEIDDSSYH